MLMALTVITICTYCLVFHSCTVGHARDVLGVRDHSDHSATATHPGGLRNLLFPNAEQKVIEVDVFMTGSLFFMEMALLCL